MVGNNLPVSIASATRARSRLTTASVSHLQLESEHCGDDERSESRRDKPETLRPAQTPPWLPSATEEVHACEQLRSGGATPGMAESVTHTWRSSSERTGQPSLFTPASVGTSSEAGASTASSASATELFLYRPVTLLKRDAGVGG